MIKKLLGFTLTLTALTAMAAEGSQNIAGLLSLMPLDGQQLMATSFSQTLYTFDPDQSAGKPSCNAAWAEKWPPLLLNAQEFQKLRAEAPAAIASELALVKRDSGLTQLAFKGNPLYTFFLDRLPSEQKGDGLGGVWHSALIAP
jgi:predicted lipoprotein with Yx(FWY)xxD motif